MITELSFEKVRRLCPESALDFPSEIPGSALKTIIGQDRAVRALQFGLGIQSKGFNIYVAGLPGTGKTTAVKQFLEILETSIRQGIAVTG